MERPLDGILAGFLPDSVPHRLRPQEVPADSEKVPADSGADSPVVVADGERLKGEWVGRLLRWWLSRAFPTRLPRWQSFGGVLQRRLHAREGLQVATEYGPACIQDPDHVPAWYRYLAETFGRTRISCRYWSPPARTVSI